MDAYDLVIAMMAFKKDYGQAVDQLYFEKALLAKYPHPALRAAGIRPHHMHGDSADLQAAFYELVRNGILRRWTPDMLLTWEFPLSPWDYFDQYIRPSVTGVRIRELEELAMMLP